MAPLVFIHYGNPAYLPVVLRTARRFNPELRVVLLGDDSNRRACRGLAEHARFEDFAGDPLLAEFDAVFRVIQGERHRFTKLGGTEFWLRFVFRRWFFVHAFLEAAGVDAFWTFDTDTLVLCSLAIREQRFAGYDCTEQCGGACLNGFVGSRRLVGRYLRAMTDMFRDESFLAAQRERLKVHAGLAFNEMDAYGVFRDRAGLRTVRASAPINGECFDDALVSCDGYETSPVRVLGRVRIKRLWCGREGGIYARLLDGTPVRLLSCNMSWMPDFLYHRLAAGGDPDGPPVALREVPLAEPHGARVARWARRVRWAMQRAFSRA